MNYGFFRASCATPAVTVADCDANTASIISFAQKASHNGADVVVFPELCVTSYTCADLFEQQTLLTSAVASLETLVNESVNISPLFIVGVPLLIQNTLYNTAAIIFRGALLAVVPKSFIPTYSEFYERRWFTPADGTLPATVTLSDTLRDIPFGTDIIIADTTTPDRK